MHEMVKEGFIFSSRWFIPIIVLLLMSPLVTGIKTPYIAKTHEIRLSPHDPIYINSNNGFTQENGVISGDGSAANPYTIANWSIRLTVKDLFDGKHGVFVGNTSKYFVIENCYIHSLDGRLSSLICDKILGTYGSNGITLHNVSNGRIENCCIVGMYGSIDIENGSCNNVVANCSCVRNFCGIGINRFSHNNTVVNCTTRNYGCGICLWDNVYDNVVKDSECKKVGINIYNSHHNKVEGCTIHGCFLYPAMKIFRGSYNNTICGCTFCHNRFGLKVFDDSNSNLIYLNNFKRNIHQAYDECSNRWDNGSIGNYWSDYKDMDNDGDGIYDHPYRVDGGNNKDMFPLVNPVAVN
ncbi:MAG TPA: hypothetical protein ENI42_04650 [Thermoplasmatales archaeon]|nr:hypothetical protein [Thermoplasmatales archaeon]